MPSSALPPKLLVGDVLVSPTTYTEATSVVLDAARTQMSLVASATSAHGVALAAREPAFAHILNSFPLVTPDGQPVRWALNLLHGAGLKERVYGPTLMRNVLERAAGEKLSVYFYGGRPVVLARLILRLNASLPALEIAGFSSPPFRTLSSEEDLAETERIVASGADIVFVGLGCPRQERWAFAHRERLQRPLVCVGAAFDFHAGALRQAPPWMQARGLEWFFRLLTEPRRLWRRYATYLPIFVLAVARQYLAMRLGLSLKPSPKEYTS